MALIVRLLAATLYLIPLTQSVGDPECREAAKGSIKNLTVNAELGGHVWQHIYGLNEKPNEAESKETQYNKSMFWDIKAFNTAFNNLLNLTRRYNFTNCPNNGGNRRFRIDVISGPEIGVYDVYLCIKVDNQNLCKVPVNANSLWEKRGKFIVFVYKWVNGQWVVRTAWPKIFVKNVKLNLGRIVGQRRRRKKFRGKRDMDSMLNYVS